MATGPFGDDVLEANRRGELGEAQLTRLGHQLDRNHSGIVGRLSRGLSPFAKDIKAGRVEMIEGAITKEVEQLLSGLPQSPHYFVHVANREIGTRRMRTYKDVFDAAPDAGFVRAYYTPNSHWIVNLELLPDPPVGDVTTSDMARAEAVRQEARSAHDAVGEAEARAKLGAMQREGETFLPDPATVPAPSAPDQLGTAILGSWESPFLSIAFHEDGTLDARTPDGSVIDGTWSVGADGQLHANIMGGAGSADASVNGDDLTVVVDGQALRLRRTSPA